MRRLRAVSAAALAGALVISLATSADAQRRQRKPPVRSNPLFKAMGEHALSEDEIVALHGKKANLLLADGKRVDDAKLVKLITGRDKARIKTISVEVVDKSGKSRTRGFPGKKLYRIEVEEKQYQLTAIESAEVYALIDVERRDKAVQAQLDSKGQKLWETLSDDDHQKHVDEYKKYLEKVAKHFEHLPLELHESKYFLFMTDMPFGDVAPYLRQLDAMNEKLGEAFAILPGENIWRGKAVVIAFVQQADFIEFEKTFMELSTPENIQGRCHGFGDGRVITALYRGNDPTYFAVILVHETSHGYMHRYKSDCEIPRWLNEGIADWIAGVIVPASPSIARRQQIAAQRLRKTGSLEGMFHGDMQAWQYGVASAMVDLLIRQDPNAFRLFFEGIKEGLAWEDSLERAYSATPDDLVALYANSIGVPELRP